MTWAATENDPNTQWQMIYPTPENTCVVFGINDMAQRAPWKQDAAIKGDVGSIGFGQ